MRRIGLLLLGLVFLAGGAGMFAYRQFGWTPDQMIPQASREAPATRGAERDFESRREFRSQRRDEFRDNRQAARDGRGWRTRDGQWRIAEMLLDGLNAVVGLVGIFLAIRGGRTSRQSMEMTAANGR